MSDTDTDTASQHVEDATMDVSRAVSPLLKTRTQLHDSMKGHRLASARRRTLTRDALVLEERATQALQDADRFLSRAKHYALALENLTRELFDRSDEPDADEGVDLDEYE